MPQNLEEPSAAPEGGMFRSWIATCLELAADHGSGVPLGELAALLPPGGLLSDAALEHWLGAHPDVAEVRDGWVFAAGRVGATYRERLARAGRYQAAARRLLDGPLRTTLPWLRCVGITGSTAYGAADDGDDLDFLIIVQDGFLWLAILRIYLGLRRTRRVAGVGPIPRLCFNYVRDDTSVRVEFAQRQDRLFAREALTARIIEGESYFAGLLESAAWIGAEFPVIYARRRAESPGYLPPPTAAPWVARAGNAAAFLALACYLQLAGLRRNARLRRAGRTGSVFRTQTTLGGLSFDSVRFETIRAHYAIAIPRVARPGASGRDSDGAGARPTPRA